VRGLKALEIREKIECELEINPHRLERKIAGFIKRKVEGASAKGVVMGLSGGVDSAVVASLSVEALGRRRVLGLILPEVGVTPIEDVRDARRIVKKLGIEFRYTNITPIIRAFRSGIADFRRSERMAAANLKPRVRMTILYYYANSLNRLVAGTGNRSELRAGYFTKYGDGGADILPLGCLYKTQVLKLAEHLKIPKHIIEKIPSAGLWRGQTDEGELGLPYAKLDMIYAGLDLGLKEREIAGAIGVNVERVRSFIERERKVAHKLSLPEIPKL
jgi:NAD+ synthase